MLALDCGAETGCKRMNSLHFAYRLLIRRSLVRAQVEEPKKHKHLARIFAGFLLFWSAVRSIPGPSVA